MKIIFRRLSFVLCMVSINAWAFDPKLPPPEEDRKWPSYAASRFPVKEEKYSVYSVPDSYFGINPAKRGSLIAGALLGPLGVLANTGYVDGEAKRQADGLRQVFALDLKAMLQEKLGVASLPQSKERGTQFEIIPAAIIFFRDEENFHAACAITTVLSDSAGNVTWKARYIAYLDSPYTVKTPEVASDLARDMPDCISKTNEMFQSHMRGVYQNAVPYDVDLGDVSLRLFIHEKMLPERVIALDNVGVSDMRKSTIKNLTRR